MSALKNAKTSALNATNIATRAIVASEAANCLPIAAQATIQAKGAMDKAKGKQGAGLAVMIAGLSYTGSELDPKKHANLIPTLPANRVLTFDITAGGDVHQFVECPWLDVFGWSESDAPTWAYNGEGKLSRDARSAFKDAVMRSLFDMPAKDNAAAWTMLSKAVPVARAIIREGMSATVENGELKLSGGKSELADAMREAKSLAAVQKAAAGLSGSNRKRGESTDGTKAGDQAMVATPEQIFRAAHDLIARIAKGEETATESALSYARAIADTVAKHKDAFAAD